MSEQVELISAGFIEEADIERLLRRARTHRRVHQEGEPIARGDRPDTGMSICSPGGVGSVAVS
ncbi:hypothetical protein [Mesorhizobium sp. M0019]|uniref:hypothetical protein n=1 Tax=unclassified Mesorhizobium TaxID=325217 RepID=UPI0033378BF1